MRLGLFIFFIFSIVGMSFAIPVLVNIKESLTGHFSYFNYSFKGEVLQINAVWENIGSVTCDTYFMVKAFDSNNRSLGYFWSRKVNTPPGKAANFRLYVFVPYYNGTITLMPRLYYCNEIQNYKIITINYYNSTNLSELALNISYELHPEKVIFKFNQSLTEDLYLVPIKQPPGWIIPSIKVNKGMKEVSLPYYRPKNSYKKLSFYFTDGFAGKSIEVLFKDEWKKPSFWQRLLSFLKELF